MKKKIKLRDMTKEQFTLWCYGHCPNDKSLNTRVDCTEVKCPFIHVLCNEQDHDNCWLYNKEDFSDKFLDQEIEIEVPDNQEDKAPNILTKEEKDYIEAVIKPFKNKVVSISKACASDLCFLVIDLGAIRDEKFGNIFDYVNTNYVKNNECYVGMERDRPYTLEELGL